MESYKHYKGFAAVARTGAKSAKFTDFHEKVTFGVKMSSKVTFCDFGVPKVAFAPRLSDVPVGNGFFDVFSVPGRRNVTFGLKSHFLHFCDFGGQK